MMVTNVLLLVGPLLSNQMIAFKLQEDAPRHAKVHVIIQPIICTGTEAAAQLAQAPSRQVSHLETFLLARFHVLMANFSTLMANVQPPAQVLYLLLK